MAVSATVYTNALAHLASKDVDLTDGTVTIALLDNTYVPDRDADEFFVDVSASELATAGGYTAGGIVLGTPVLTEVNHQQVLSGDSPLWAATTITWRYAVIFYDTGNSATSPLISLIDFGANVSTTATDATWDWSVNGVLSGTAL